MTFCERILEAIAAGGSSIFNLLLILQAYLNGCF
jgi:hypothetical protein